MLAAAADTIERLTVERDEAQRELKVMAEEHRLACADRDLMQRQRDSARPSLCDIVVSVEVDQDQKTSKKHGHDLSLLAAVKVATTFVMTPEFVEDLHRANTQYEQVGSMVALALKNAVTTRKGTDIRSIAIVRPMIARSHT
jgi:hypothetical protein